MSASALAASPPTADGHRHAKPGAGRRRTHARPDLRDTATAGSAAKDTTRMPPASAWIVGDAPEFIAPNMYSGRVVSRPIR